jgi:hypothetical protein
MGVGGWLHGVQSKYHVFSETYVRLFLFTPASFRTPPVPILTRRYGHSVSTVRAALEVKQVFEQLAEAEKGGVTPEQKQKLEEQATEKVCPNRHLYSLLVSMFLVVVMMLIQQPDFLLAVRRVAHGF